MCQEVKVTRGALSGNQRKGEGALISELGGVNLIPSQASHVLSPQTPHADLDYTDVTQSP